MDIMTEASNLISEDQFNARVGPNSKMQFKPDFKGAHFAEMITTYGISILYLAIPEECSLLKCMEKCMGHFFFSSVYI